jgi:hypothetical protein
MYRSTTLSAHRVGEQDVLVREKGRGREWKEERENHDNHDATGVGILI